MQTKYIERINQLTGTEFKELGSFLNSPWINSNKKLVRLYDFIRKYRSAFLCGQFTNRDIYKKLYDGKRYQKKTIWNLSSKMNKVIERYLICSRCMRPPQSKVVLGSELGQDES
jgi:hypothetical protein